MFVLPDFEPLDKVLSALESGVQAILLTFETGHILHGDTINTWEKLGMSGSEEKMGKQEETISHLSHTNIMRGLSFPLLNLCTNSRFEKNHHSD